MGFDQTSVTELNCATAHLVSDKAIPLVATASKRLVSLDALRGFTMFWLIGGREFCLALIAILTPSYFEAFETHVTHPKWDGFVTWDMVMPLFLFMVGTSIPFAMAKRLKDKTTLASTYGRIARRVALLWIFGWIAQVTKYETTGIELYSNTLQAIAVGYLVTSLALLHLRVRAQIGLFLSLLLAYGLILMFVPFGSHPAGTMEKTANLPLYIDQFLLGSFRRDHPYTWILSSLGFAATVLLGSLAGHLLRAKTTSASKLMWLIVLGLVCLVSGWLWSYYLPLNRHLWTSSMVLWSGGFSFLLLALFYAIIDMAGYTRWAFPWVIIGSNALLAYLLDPIFVWIGHRLATPLVLDESAATHDLLFSFFEISLLFALLWYLYKKRLFLRA